MLTKVALYMVYQERYIYVHVQYFMVASHQTSVLSLGPLGRMSFTWNKL